MKTWFPISIHAPLAGRDEKKARRHFERRHFNPRAPRGARPPVTRSGERVEKKFQSTRPSRGATLGVRIGHRRRLEISIHAPLAGRDQNNGAQIGHREIFQSTRPSRGATARRFMPTAGTLFQSTRPSRGATYTIYAFSQKSAFQSTRPSRGATAKVNKFLRTFLQKRHGFQIFFRKTLPFKAFCRLQIGKNFSICGANRCGNFCELLLRTIRSSVLPEGRSACSQNAQFYSHTFFRDNRNADCLFPDP